MPTPQEKCDQWNREHETGRVVDYRRCADGSKTVRTVTRTHANVIYNKACVKLMKFKGWCGMDSMTPVPFTEPPEWDRASGRCVCEECGKLYLDHPPALDYPDYRGLPTLTELCNGRIVKL